MGAKMLPWVSLLISFVEIDWEVELGALYAFLFFIIFKTVRSKILVQYIVLIPYRKFFLVYYVYVYRLNLILVGSIMTYFGLIVSNKYVFGSITYLYNIITFTWLHSSLLQISDLVIQDKAQVS